jgi:AcrR family transcriptional regulator
MEEVASQAGFTKRTLYGLFPSKLALFISIFDDYLQQLKNEIAAAIEAGGAVDEILYRVFETQLEFNRKHHRFMWHYWTLDPDEFGGFIPAELTDRIKYWNDAIFKMVLDLLVEGQQKGIIHSEDIGLLINLIAAVNKGILLHTQKQNRLSIATVNSEELGKLFWSLISPAIFLDKKHPIQAESTSETSLRKNPGK